MPHASAHLNPTSHSELLEAFRNHYHRFERSVHDAVVNSADTVVLWRLGDDLDQYTSLVTEVSVIVALRNSLMTMLGKYSQIFMAAEHDTIMQSLAIMRNDVRQQYEQTISESHHGHPTIVETIHTGQRGRPSLQINREFLQWAYSLRSISSIAHFLEVSRGLVRQQLVEHGIAEPQSQPFMLSAQYTDDGSDGGNHDDDDVLDPSGDVSSPIAPSDNMLFTTSYTSPQSAISDNELDDLVIRLRRHFRRAGVTMLGGMLRRLGYRISRERISQSLVRIDPVQRVFQRIRIRRRVYSVPGPNSLWHHDGQHGM
jgi:hypothetical protein